MTDQWAGFKPADVGLAETYPLAEQGLGDTARTVDRVMVGMCAVDPGHPAHVLGGKSFPELLALPELGGNLGRSDELVP
ncbi:MAG: hypothetical protein ACRDSF_10365 [Pseudonocardiaceae bacterium]